MPLIRRSRPCCRADSDDPASVYPFPGRQLWHYGSFKVTQYWKKPRGTARDDLHVVVNARYTYWQTRHPVPGGVAFENFELREHFYEGQVFVFGITRKTPAQLWAASDRRSPPPQTNQIERTAGNLLPFVSWSARLPSKHL